MKKEIRIQKWTRTIIRLVFFLAMPGSFVAGFSGVRYIFQQISVGGVIEFNSFLLALVVLAAFTILFGRFFCGYVCAFGSFGDFVYWLSGIIQTIIFKRKKQFTLPEKIIPWGQKVKYVVLLAVVVLCVLGVYDAVQGYSPWSVFSFFMALKPSLLTANYIPGLVILILIIAGMALKERFFCQFLCPLGAIFSLLPQLPFAFLKRDPENCLKGCSACKKKCPVDLKLEADGFRNGECISCDQCAAICPKHNLTRWDRKLVKKEFVAAILKAVIFFVIGGFAGLSRFWF